MLLINVYTIVEFSDGTGTSNCVLCGDKETYAIHFSDCANGTQRKVGSHRWPMCLHMYAHAIYNSMFVLMYVHIIYIENIINNSYYEQPKHKSTMTNLVGVNRLVAIQDLSNMK